MAEFRFPMPVICLLFLAGLSGCATGGGNWDRPYEAPVEATRLSLSAEIELMMRKYWAFVYGIEVEDLMGPFENEPDGLPVEEAVYLGPYFDEDALFDESPGEFKLGVEVIVPF